MSALSVKRGSQSRGKQPSVWLVPEIQSEVKILNDLLKDVLRSRHQGTMRAALSHAKSLCEKLTELIETEE